MSAREWKPGDVALLRVERWSSATEWPEDTSQVLMRLADDGRYWNAVDGDPAAPLTVHVGQTDYYHPLVVIDPEDHEQVDRLLSLYYNGVNGGYVTEALKDRFQTALREFANPTPPKPDEPTGLGAVVKATCGCRSEAVRFVRDPAARDFNLPWNAKGVPRGDEVPWVALCGHHRYDDLSAVRVLSEGVTEDGA